MRLWTVHPKYLDSQALVTLWRESLLAREVLRGRTQGYRSHPQLHRFLSCAAPRSAINAYLAAVYAEACSRGYAFDRSKLGRVAWQGKISATDGQLRYEWQWLLRKLRVRSPELYRRHCGIQRPDAHPAFRISRGPVQEWERVG